MAQDAPLQYDRPQKADALITVPQPPGLHGPLLYPTSITGTAGLALDFTVVHPVSRRGTEHTCEETWFVPVVAATSGALHPETLRFLYDFARLKTDAAEQYTVVTMPAPQRNVRSTPDGGSAVQPPGLSYTAHWEALGCAPCLLTTPEISSTGPVRDFAPAPTAHVLASRYWCGPGTSCCAVSLLRSPGPCSPTVFRSTICDCLSINGCFSLL